MKMKWGYYISIHFSDKYVKLTAETIHKTDTTNFIFRLTKTRVHYDWAPFKLNYIIHLAGFKKYFFGKQLFFCVWPFIIIKIISFNPKTSRMSCLTNFIFLPLIDNFILYLYLSFVAFFVEFSYYINLHENFGWKMVLEEFFLIIYLNWIG